MKTTVLAGPTLPPNPGSHTAVLLGCSCPVLDNAHGEGITAGYGGAPGHPVFWVTAGCKLHDRRDPVTEGQFHDEGGLP